MKRKLKLETMEKRTKWFKEFTIEELEYCKRMIDNIIDDVKEVQYKDIYEPSEDFSDGKYAAEVSNDFMVTIRAILSRYWKNKRDTNHRIYDRRLERHKNMLDKMWEVVRCVDDMDRL
jgi:hypothetical protein